MFASELQIEDFFRKQSGNKFRLNGHNDHRAGAGVDIVREYEVQLGSRQIQMKFYLEKMKLR